MEHYIVIFRPMYITFAFIFITIVFNIIKSIKIHVKMKDIYFLYLLLFANP